MTRKKKQSSSQSPSSTNASEGQDPSTAMIPPNELLYIIDLEAFVVRGKDGLFDTQTLLGKDAARNYLSAKGYNAAQVKAYVNGMGYMKVRRFYSDAGQPQLCVDQHGERCINSYIFPTLAPALGEYPSIEKIVDYLTKNDAEGKAWLYNWMAAKIQKPTQPLPTAVAFLGAAGTGKSTFVRIMNELVGPRNCVALGQNLLASGFTAGWAGKCLVNVDEAFSGEDNLSLGYKVKRILTADEIEYHAKGRDPVWVKNCAAWIFTSNGLMAVREDEDDRRLTSFVQTEKPSPEYVLMLKGLFDGTKPTEAFMREIAALKADLLALDVNVKMLTSPYLNDAKKEIAALSRNSAEDFWTELTDVGLEVLSTEVQAERFEEKVAFPAQPGDEPGKRAVSKRDLYSLYARFSKQNGQKAVARNKFFGTGKSRFGVDEGPRKNNSRTVVVKWN